MTEYGAKHSTCKFLVMVTIVEHEMMKLDAVGLRFVLDVAKSSDVHMISPHHA